MEVTSCRGCLQVRFARSHRSPLGSLTRGLRLLPMTSISGTVIFLSQVVAQFENRVMSGDSDGQQVDPSKLCKILDTTSGWSPIVVFTGLV